MEKRKSILLILIPIFFLTFFTRVFFSKKPEKVKSLTYTGKREVLGKRTDKKKPDKLLFSKIENRSSENPKIKRNLFSFLKEPSPGEVKKEKVLEVIEPRIEAPPPVERASFIDDMNKYKFFGFLKKNGKYTLFLSRDEEILLTKVGKKIKDKYEIKNFMKNKLTLYSHETDEAIELNLEDDLGRESNFSSNGVIKKGKKAKRPNLLEFKEKDGFRMGYDSILHLKEESK